MALIDYDQYLDGEFWPSESGQEYNQQTQSVEPELVAAADMPPQYAVSALHKLVRWAVNGTLDPENEAKEEIRVRNSVLGRCLARRALSIDDFELSSEHGVERAPLGAHDIAYELATQMLVGTKKTLIKRMTPEEIGFLASTVAVGMIDEGYLVYRNGGDLDEPGGTPEG